MSVDQIRERFGWSELMMATLEKDHIATQDEALLDIYRKLRPGEPPTRENAQTLLHNLFFNPKRYDLAKVGRYKFNKKLGLDVPITTGVLTEEDILATVEYLIRLHEGEDGYEPDDIDHFGNRRIRTVGELIQNQIRVGLSRMERVVRERMTTQDVEAITPQTLINIRPVVAAIKEFFGTSQLSQFMDQTNPLAGLTHRRRLNALGPGGLSRERAGLRGPGRPPVPLRPDVSDRDSGGAEHRSDRRPVHLRPGQPVRVHRDAVPKVIDGKVTDQIEYLTADEEDRYVKAQANDAAEPRRQLRHRPGAGAAEGR